MKSVKTRRRRKGPVKDLVLKPLDHLWTEPVLTPAPASINEVLLQIQENLREIRRALEKSYPLTKPRAMP